ncbi:MAG: repeat-containing protein, partial [Bacteroidetes bacterium]|nr:repeat-containing protein [Bacteroidota bacterium]
MNIAKDSITVRVTSCILLLALLSSVGNAQTLPNTRSHAGLSKAGRRPAVSAATSPDVRKSQEVPPRVSDFLGGERPDFRVATIIEVTNTLNSGIGSLRKSIDSANANPGPDVINFNIPASGVITISPPSSLPNITGPVVIDGTTQSGYAGTPLIVLDGSSAGLSVNGLTLFGGNSVVRGLAINGFRASGLTNGMGIYIDGGGGNKIEGCYIGTDAAGMIARPNGGVAIGIFGASGSNIVGGTAPSARNVLSGNGLHGVQISPGTTGRNVVQGNFFGVNAAGTGALGNTQAGVAIFGSTFPDTIGGTAAGARNILSGNGFMGLYIAPSVSGIVVQGNYFGTDVTGSLRIPNIFEGIQLEGPRNIIGGPTIAESNVLSGNGNSGIYIYTSSATGNKIQGNYIGTAANGTDTLGNTFGIVIDHAPNDTIGAAIAGGGNLLSGNYFAGIYIYHPTSTGNVVQGNFIGTDITGNLDRGNLRYGVVLDSASNNLIGGTSPLSGNKISGNDSSGIYIVGTTATGNKVFGNYIGTNSSGVSALPNLKGILIDNAPKNTFGGTTLGEINIISGNTSFGIEIRNAGATGNKIVGNSIGTDALSTGALGNGSYGVLINSSQDTIGGATASAGNTIAYNHGAGVYDSSGTGNLIRMNSIFSNSGGLGIDLGPRGLARNDSLDPDIGANNLQNFPLLDSATVTGGNTTIHGRFNSLPLTKFYIDFFSNVKYDSSHFGEGETYIGSTTLTTDAGGNDSIKVVLPIAVPLNRYITATAIDSATGNTSEFSQAICLSDSDADGIMDSWETQGWGIDVNSDSVMDLDLYTLGARSQHKDLFLEVDAMAGLTPRQAALDTVVKSFAKVPNLLVNNPDGAIGVKLHIDPLDADTTIPVANWPNYFTDFDVVKKIYFGTKAQRSSPDSTYILQAKNLVYRYCIFGRTYGVGSDTGSSGLAELANGLGGNDFMVTLGSVGARGWNGGSLADQAGTLMHEMGHTLGLWHGGNNNQNYKPNYYGVMNYTWQTVFNWQPAGSWRLNYSTDSLATLNEASLSEPVGLSVPGPYTPYPLIAVPFTDSLRNLRWARMRTATAVDWTGNGDSTRVGASVDINLVGDTSATLGEMLNGFADWRHIVYNFRHSPNFTPGVHTNLLALEPEMTREIFDVLNNLPPPQPSGKFLMDGLLDTSATLLASNAGIDLYARYKSGQLYVATNSAQSQAADMFIFISDAQNPLRSAPLGKTGQVAAWTVYLGNESTDNSSGWSDATEAPLTNITVDTAGTVLEGVVDVELLYGTIPTGLFIAVGKYGTDAGGALVAQVPLGNGDGNIDPAELFPFSDPALPIQLASFTATFVPGVGVRLEWLTLSELNNYGFEVQRRGNGQTTFESLPNGFVPGHGTTIEPHQYVYIDSTGSAGHWFYRLKQIDLDGSVWYGPSVEVEVLTSVGEDVPKEFALMQNHPNPFNPSTTIRFEVPLQTRITIKVYDILGREVTTLIDESRSPGRYHVDWNATHVASGVYFYRMTAGAFSET